MTPRAPDPRLAGAVLGYTGYAERSAVPLRRMQVPTTVVPLILSLGPPIVVDGVEHTSFVAGMHDAVATTEYAGEQLGVQVDLTPLGARRLIGLPMAELARQVVAVEDVLGPSVSRLVDRLREAATWEARFALLDHALLERLYRGAPVAGEIGHAWARLEASGGAVRVETLAREVGWSRRHLSARFRADVGLPPKAVARILRFERVTELLRASSGPSLADAAFDCGYADQAHLNRDFRAFAGTTPTDFVARLIPDMHDVEGRPEVTNVQDGLARAA